MRFALPTWKTVVKWILSGLAAIILGAIGSGVWQSLLGPAVHTSTTWVLYVASLGLTSYKNSVYQQIAADNQTLVAHDTFILVLWMTSTSVGLLLGYASLQLKRLQRFWTERSDASVNRKPDTTEFDPATELNGVKKIRLVLYAFTLGAIFLLGQILVSSARRTYVNSADAHYHQVLRVASPYLDTAERAAVESDFAQTSSREDYVKVLSTLERLCRGSRARRSQV